MSKVLIVEDEYALAAALATLLRRMGAEPVVAASGQGGLDKLTRGAFDLVLLDIGLPDMSGLRVLEKVRALPVPPPVLVITAHGSLENALEARRLGAQEYFLKPLKIGEIQLAIRALLEAKPEALAEAAAPVVQPAQGTMMIGAAPTMQRCFAIIAQACGSDAAALISGPPGSGKTLAARVIHAHGGRAGQPLRTIECGPASEPLFLPENLGETLSGGVVVLRGVQVLSAGAQKALMEWIDAGHREARLIAISQGDLHECVWQGKFREDLFYQLAVLHVAMPALVDRVSDIPALAAFFLSQAAPDRDLQLAEATSACLLAHEWPGNVRELLNAMHHVAAVCPGTEALPHHLPASVPRLKVAGESATHLDRRLREALESWLDLQMSVPESELPEYEKVLGQVEGMLLAALLRRFDEKPTRLAAAMNMNRATLRKRCRELLGWD
ncbi:MAG: sigma-54-dependent Fis family transcriptional regulator [Verrucomicrobiaceae bacterium]|nr:sigma-54-dependent Fis family transcriptional regulator [Verrucomicrobiaceae bacterium]